MNITGGCPVVSEGRGVCSLFHSVEKKQMTSLTLDTRRPCVTKAGQNGTLILKVADVDQCGSANGLIIISTFFICSSVLARLNTSELEWYIHPHGDSSHGCQGPVEQQVRLKKKFLNLFQINQLPLQWMFMQLKLFRCRYLVHALEITVRGRWKPQTRAMERMHTLSCVHRCCKTANKKLECVRTMLVYICV